MAYLFVWFSKLYYQGPTNGIFLLGKNGIAELNLRSLDRKQFAADRIFFTVVYIFALDYREWRLIVYDIIVRANGLRINCGIWTMAR